MALDCQGQIRRAGMAGVATGFDMVSLLAVAEARGIDKTIATQLLPALEAGMVTGLAKQAEDGNGRE